MSPRETCVTVKVVGEGALAIWRGVFSVFALARRLSDCAGRGVWWCKVGVRAAGSVVEEARVPEQGPLNDQVSAAEGCARVGNGLPGCPGVGVEGV